MIPAIYQLALVPVIALLGIAVGLFLKGFDRILSARMQARVGPPLAQPFLDVKKLFMKENIVPKNAVPWLFNIMPVIALAASIAILLYLPLFGLAPLLEGYGDLILVLYLLTIPSVALVLGGFASASPYATVGAQREMVTMLSYEFPLAIAMIGIAWLVSIAGKVTTVFSLTAISSTPVWALVGPLGLIGLAIMLLVLLIVMPAKLSNVPFDAPEAETEIGSGLLAEYSGRNLALFYLADAVKTVAMASLVIALFLPWNLSQHFGLPGCFGLGADALFFLAKIFLVSFVASTFVRTAVARFRITQIVKFYWSYAALAAAFGLLLIAIDLAIF